MAEPLAALVPASAPMVQHNVLVIDGHTGGLQFPKCRDDALGRQIAGWIVLSAYDHDSEVTPLSLGDE